MFRAEISSALSSFLRHSRAPELAQRTMKCEGKVEPKENAVKRQRTTLGGEKALLVSENGASRLARQIGLDFRLIRCAEGVGTGSQMHAYAGPS